MDFNTLFPGLNTQVLQAVKDSQQDALTLTSDQISAIFRRVAHTEIVVPMLPDNPTPEEVLASEQLILQADQDLATMAQAEVQDAAAVKAVKERAQRLAQSIGATLAVAGITALTKTLEAAPK